MAEHPLKVLETVDPELFKLVQSQRDFALADGALPKKVKLLIAAALDANYGSASGVAALARQAMEAGATRQEVTEAVRVAQYMGGAFPVFAAAAGLKELF